MFGVLWVRLFCGRGVWMGVLPAVVWVGGVVGAEKVAAAGEDRKPNILFIMTDQHRFDALGANGNSIIKTPHLDRLAERSANFQNAFVQAPVCVPSRATWFTGRYPHSHRNRVNYTPLDRREVLMQQYLKEAGYATGSVGKLHLYPPTVAEAKRTGFDLVWLHDGVGRTDPFSDYVKWRNANDPQRDVPYRALAKDVEPGANPFRAAIADGYTDTSWVGLKARESLTQLANGAKPFFLFVSFWKPHSPYEVPAPFDAMYSDVEIPLPKPVTLAEIKKLPLPVQKQILRGEPLYDMDRERLQWVYRSYYAGISHIDREVGSILETLKQVGAEENTIVVFSSDHGDQLLEHGLVGKNVLFEASIRVPFLFCYPGRVHPGQYGALIETTDLLPTLLALAGIDEPKHCQGRSFAPLIGDWGTDYEMREVVFAENVIPEVITSGQLDFQFKKGQGVGGIRHPDAKMVRSHRYKLNYYPGHGGELYDLEKDPGEEHNLYADPDHAGIVADLKGKLLDWMITTDETEQIAEKWRFLGE